MRATTVMLLAIGILVLTHWANNEPTVNPKMVVELAFALLVIAFLDQGKTEPVATSAKTGVKAAATCPHPGKGVKAEACLHQPAFAKGWCSATSERSRSSRTWV